MAALAVARMIAKAATSTRSDRDNASLVFLVIGESDSFGFRFRFVYLAWSISLPAFLCPFRHRIAFAISIRLVRFRYVLKKFRMCPSTVA